MENPNVTVNGLVVVNPNARTDRRQKTARRFCGTLNNPTEEEWNELEDVWLSEQLTYMLVGKEVGIGGTPHLQMYVHAKDSIRITGLKRIMKNERWHIEVCGGSPKANWDYCTKEGDFQEWGAIKNVGQRTDIDEVAEKIKNRIPMNEIAKEHAKSYIRYHRGFNALNEIFQEKRSERTRILILHGAPGIGKTSWVCDNLPILNCFFVSAPRVKNGGVWWAGYDPLIHKYVIWDDIRPDQAMGIQLINLGSFHPMMCETKGAQVHFNSGLVIFTSNMHWWRWCDWSSEDKGAFQHRIDTYGCEIDCDNTVGWDKIAQVWLNRYLSGSLAQVSTDSNNSTPPFIDPPTPSLEEEGLEGLDMFVQRCKEGEGLHESFDLGVTSHEVVGNTEPQPVTFSYGNHIPMPGNEKDKEEIPLLESPAIIMERDEAKKNIVISPESPPPARKRVRWESQNDAWMFLDREAAEESRRERELEWSDDDETESLSEHEEGWIGDPEVEVIGGEIVDFKDE